MEREKQQLFIEAIDELTSEAYKTITKRRPQYIRDIGAKYKSVKTEFVADIIKELIEFQQAEGVSKHLSGITESEEELADVVIACFSNARFEGFKEFGKTILKKMEYNMIRED